MLETYEDHTHRFQYPSPQHNDVYLLGTCLCGATKQGLAWALEDNMEGHSWRVKKGAGGKKFHNTYSKEQAG